MPLIAVDIGSNSILVTVAEVKQTSLNIIEDFSYVTGLGRQIQKNGFFIKEAMDDSTEALSRIVLLADKYKIPRKKILITSTEASRRASNSIDFFTSLTNAFGIDVKIISPTAEAYFAALGLTLSPGPKKYPAIVLDIGGASTELTVMTNEPFKVLETISMPIGSVVVSENPAAVSNCLNQDSFQDFRSNKTNFELWAISGSAIALAQNVLQKKNHLELEGEIVQMKLIHELSAKLLNSSEVDLISQFGKRSKTIIGGLHILKSILDSLNISSFKISNYGLRHGVLFKGEIPNGFIWQCP